MSYDLETPTSLSEIGSVSDGKGFYKGFVTHATMTDHRFSANSQSLTFTLEDKLIVRWFLPNECSLEIALHMLLPGSNKALWVAGKVSSSVIMRPDYIHSEEFGLLCERETGVYAKGLSEAL